MRRSKACEMPLPPSQPPSLLRPAEICCMCGDYGLADELFRCRICFFRFQHKYCSNLYPRAHSYRACNWCLGKEAGRSSSLSLKAEPAIAGNNSLSFTLASPIAHRSDGCGGKAVDGGREIKLGRRTISPKLNRPEKKQKFPSRRPQSRGEHLSTGIRKKGPVLRVKVRRYKLLEEVFC